jgi:cytidylate kinase
VNGDFAFRPGERAALAARLGDHAPALARLVIAIDGPAASGKSSTARAVAARLGVLHLDTGAMYRAVTLLALRAGTALDDGAALAALAAAHEIRLEPSATGPPRVRLDGDDVTDAVRGAAVTASVSQVAAHPEVRAEMVRRQRVLGRDGGIVADGRDIGTVVFPDADVKVFLVADAATRAQRRQLEEAARGAGADLVAIAADLERRDRDDSTRAVSPLVPADDALRLDTTALAPADQIEAVLALAVRRVRGDRIGSAPRGAAGRVGLTDADPERTAQPGFRPFHSGLYRWVHTAIRTLARAVFGLRIHVHPAARQPGSVLYACNHIAGFDPPIAGASLPGEVWFIAKMELFRQAWLGALIARFNAIPIRRGTADFEALDRAVELLRAGRNVMMFPEGTRQRPGTLGAPRWGFGYVALHAGRPIVPVFVRGTRDTRPRGLRREPMEVWLGEAAVAEVAGPIDHEAYKQTGDLVIQRVAGLMLRSAAATPLAGLELPGRWAAAPTIDTAPASSEVADVPPKPV